jgi:hypothetical protein
MSEDSENEETKFNAFNRKYMRERIEKHPAPFL